MKKNYFLILLTASLFLTVSANANVAKSSSDFDDSKIIKIKTFDGNVHSGLLEFGKELTIKGLKELDQITLVNGEIIYPEEIHSLLIKKDSDESIGSMQITRAPSGF